MMYGFPRISGSMRLLFMLLAAGLLFLGARPCQAEVCSNPGKDGTGTPSGIINTYYPGSGTVWAGSTTINVGSADTSSGGSSTPIAAGDLLLVMQMQDADISSSNDQFYGGSTSGAGYTFLNNSGVYEYVVAAGAVSAGSIQLASPLRNSYRTAAAFGTNGKRAFQVIRVPQYSSAILGAGLTAASWNGNTGGVVVFDVAGQLNWGGQAINVTGRGFRGGGGRNLTGQADYTRANAYDYRTPATITANASKGEGIAGTPQYVFTPATAGPDTNAAGSITNSGIDGYPNGSYARGAPGNAGGGGTDGDPSANMENTGGGGGGSYSSGGMGGYGWTPDIPPGYKTGGFGGYSVPLKPGLLTLGGGGGAGVINNNTGNPPDGSAASGAAGGGIVIIRAGSISGSGVINANGTSGNSTILTDASGGGGGGGAVLVFSSAVGGSVGGLTVNARGGNGGSNTGGNTTHGPHGPGGGGGGGYVAVTSAAGVDVSGGINGTTAGSATSTPDYGSTTASGGYQIFTVLASQIPGAGATSLCYPVLTATKTTSNANTLPGGSTAYTITVSNQAGKGQASGVSIRDLLPGLPTPFTFTALNGVSLAGGAQRTSVSNPVAGSTGPAWGLFTIPGGGSVALNFTASVPVAAMVGTYQNPVAISYSNPAAGSLGAPATISPGNVYFTGGTVAGGSNYDPSSSTQEDVSVWQPATITKNFTNVLSSTARLTVSITNPNPAPLTGVALSDNYPAGLLTASTPNLSQANCGVMPTTTATSVSLSSGSIPAGGSCIFSVDVSFTSGTTYVNTIPAGALSNNLNVTNTSPASATLNPATVPPTVTKTFSPTLIQQGGTSTLTFTLVNAAAVPLTNVSFSDSYPAGLANATPLVLGGTCADIAVSGTTVAGGSVFNLTSATIPASGTCTVTVPVTSNIPSAADGYANSTSGATSTQSGAAVGSPSNTAKLVVAGTPTISKSFTPGQIAPGGVSALTFTLTNPGNLPLTNATFNDSLANMSVSAIQSATGTCVGAVGNSFTAGQTNLNFSGLSIPANSSCTLTITVTSAVSGSNPNMSSGVSSDQTPVPGLPSNTANLLVYFPPNINKDFSPSTITTVGTSTVSLTLANPNAIPLTGVAFSDTLVNMSVSAIQSATGTCVGAAGNSFTAGQTNLNFSGLSIPANSSCTVSFVVTSSIASPSGGHPNATSGATSAQTPEAGPPSNTTYLNVLSPPTVSKAFAPASILRGQIATLTFTLTNLNAQPLTGVSFQDQFPANLDIPTTAQSYVGAGRGTCATAIPSGKDAGANPTPGRMNFSAISIPANSSCTLMVDVTSTVAASYSNIVSDSSGATPYGILPTSDQTGTAKGPNSNTATLTMTAQPPTWKLFNPATIGVGGRSTLTINLQNTGSTAATLTSLFTDTLPTGMTVANPNGLGGTCAGVKTAVTGGNTVTYANGAAIPVGGCNITATVTSSAIGTATNTIAVGSLKTTQGNNAIPATATLSVVPSPISVAKSFYPAWINSGGISTLTITLGNSGSMAANLTADLIDTLPTGMKVAAIPNSRGTCPSVSITAIADADTITYASDALIPAGGCTIKVDVTSSTSGISTNTIAANALQTTQGANGSLARATLTVNPPTVAKAFNPTTIKSGGISQLTITLGNPSGSAITLSSIFTDTLPTGMSVVSTGAGTCTAGSITASGTTVKYASGASIPNNGCTIIVNVTSSTIGTATNTVAAGALQTNRGSNPDPASAALVIAELPTTAKSFSPATISSRGTSTLTITLGNSNASPATLSASFTDALPTGMTIANPTNLGGNCATGSVTATAGSSTITYASGAAIPATTGCTISLDVTSATPGTATNSLAANALQTNLGNNAGPVTADLNVTLAAPTVAKQFSPSAIAVGSVSTLTISLGNSNATAALLTSALIDTLPAGMRVATTPNIGGSCSSASVTASAGSATVSFASGAVIPPGGCSISVDVTSSAPGVSMNTIAAGDLKTSLGNNTGAATGILAVGVTTTPSVLKSFSPAAITSGGTSTLTITLGNSNAAATTLSAALTDFLPGGMTVANVPAISGTCSTAAVTAAPGSGSITYSSGAVIPAGGCTITVNVTSSTLGTATNTIAANALQTGFGKNPLPTSAILSVTLAGVTLSGTVFSDIGSSGGTANDGVQNGTEAGLYGVAVRLTDEAGTTVYDSKVTDSSGNFTLHIPSTIANGTKLRIIETNPPAYISTGASTGSSGGSYDRTGDAVTFTFSGAGSSGITFADVPENRFLSDNTVSALPGTVVFHPHSFTAGSGGSVTFATTAFASPTLPGWSEVLYRDTNCNGSFDSGEPQITSAITLLANEQLCILIKEFVPASAPIGASNLVTASATFAYSNAVPPLSRQLTRTDNTLVGTPSGAGLTLTKAVDQGAALPGSNLTYTITYANSSSGPLSNIIIHDSVPAYTINPAACCVNPGSACLGSDAAAFPPNITSCTATISGEAITWTPTGALAPGASGQVKFRVTVQP